MENTRIKKCPQCGNISDIDANICTICGKPFEAETQLPENSNPEPEITGKSVNSPTKAIFIVFVLAILALLIIALVSQFSSEPPIVLETAAYRQTIDEVLISVQEYSYKDDMVYSIKDTVVIKTASLTEDDIAAYIEKFDALALETYNIECMTYIKEITDNKLTLGFEYSNLDNEENVKALVDAGYISASDGEVISMSRTESLLLETGYRLTTVS